MQSLPSGSKVITAGYSTRYMTNNIFYPFHQNTDFWYLSGFNEPDAAMILGKTSVKSTSLLTTTIEKDNSSRGYKQTMFVLPKNAQAELWDGPRTGVEGVKEFFGADEVRSQIKRVAFLMTLSFTKLGVQQHSTTSVLEEINCYS